MVCFVAWVYIMTNAWNNVLYTGFTTAIKSRNWEHKTKCNPGSFSARYNVTKLVYYQGFLSVSEAEAAEKYIKGKNRKWKMGLIMQRNPTWMDLSDEISKLD
jgi:putative endonuclease